MTLKDLQAQLVTMQQSHVAMTAALAEHGTVLAAMKAEVDAEVVRVPTLADVKAMLDRVEAAGKPAA